MLSDRTVVVLLHKHFSSCKWTVCNSVCIITNCTYANTNAPNITEYENNSFSFCKLAYYSWFFFHTIFRRFFTSIPLRDVDFSMTLVRKANTVGKETRWAAWLYHYRNRNTHVTDGGAVTSLLASNTKRAIRDRVCHIALNRTLSRIFDTCCKFSSRVKAKSHKKRLACISKHCVMPNQNM